MKLAARSAVVALVTGGLVLAAVDYAAGDVLPTDVRVVLDAGAPAPGATVAGALTLRGTAEGLDGVLRVDLYAVPHRPAGTVPVGEPVATTRPYLPAPRLPFAFTWHPAARQVVDLVVVARTVARSGQAEIERVTVGPPVVAVRRAPKPAHRAPAPARPVAVRRPVTAPAVRPLAVRPVRRPAPTSPVPAGQARAFYEVFGTLGYGDRTETVAEPVLAPKAATPPGAEPVPLRRVPWMAFGLGLELLACAVQSLRFVRPVPRPAFA